MTRYGLLALLLAGCPAEMLGIPVPAAGVAALSMEDITRDSRMLGRLSGDERRAFLRERWSQMGLEPSQDGQCGRRGEERAVLVRAHGGSSASEAAAGAVVISAAKALHGRPRDALGVNFCIGARRDAVWEAEVAPLGHSVRWRTREAMSDADHVAGLPVDVQLVGDGSGDVDYRVVLSATKRLVDVLTTRLEADSRSR